MTETKLSTYETEIKKERSFKSLQIKVTKYDVISRVAGFFLAMAMPLSSMAPFGISFLAQERKFSLKAIMSFVVTSLGSLVVCGRLDSMKYIGAGILYLMALFVLEKGVKFTDVAAGMVAGGCVFVTGIAQILLKGFTVSALLLLLCEVAIVISAALMMEKSGEIIRSQKFSIAELDGDTKLSLGTIAAIFILSLNNIYLGSDFSVMNCIAAVGLLIIAAGCKAGYSTGAGVILGLICGIGSDYFMPILGAFSFCGFVSGVFSKFGKGGVIVGSIIANGILVIYTNSATEAVLSLFEVIASSVIFALIPESYIEAVKEILCLGRDERESIKKIRDSLRARLSAVATAFENLSKTLDKLSDKNSNEKNSDVAAIFDATADKICKKCRKSPICWGRDFNSTYHELFTLLDVLKEKGKVGQEDVREHFLKKCSEIKPLIEELNHQFDIYRVRKVWRNKITECREIVGEQLSGMSKIIDSLAVEIRDEVKSVSVSAWEVRSRLESKGIKARDVNVMQDKNGRNRIEIIVKTAAYKDKQQTSIEKLMKTILRCHVMNKEEIKEDKKYTRLCFSEGERYTVETQYASRAASKTNGDNFRLLHLSGGKYIIAISDGMGTGTRAAKESEAILELLDSFLEAGFDSQTAVRLINSIMVMKSEENAFVTIDLCIIDLYTGEVKFIKTGAEPSFIMQKGGGVETVRGAALPVGIIPKAEADVKARRICEGDRIVMVTDGVESRENGSLWVSEFIRESCRDEEKTDLAKSILNHAIKKNSGNVKDDMTVLSVKLKAVS